MVKGLSNNFAKVRNVRGWTTCLIAAVALLLGLSGNEAAQATTGGSPYEVPQVNDTNPNLSIVEAWIVADEASVNIGNGVQATNAMTFKSCAANFTACSSGTIPGPQFRLNVGDTVIVHFRNDLPAGNVTGIHWHGIELNNASDGTPLTQNPVIAPGGTFLYQFKVTRPGLFWYHPHHHSSTNQVFKGLYGSIVIEDPNEAGLIGTTLPSAGQTKTLVLSDITVCGEPGTNLNTFEASVLPPHPSGIVLWAENYGSFINNMSPKTICEDRPVDEHGSPYRTYSPGEIPNIQYNGISGPHGEGWTVLTNGVNVGVADVLNVNAGQGLRLQIINSSAVRYMRLRLADSGGTQVDLFRIGGQGGLLDNPRLEGGTVGGFVSKYGQGQILIPPGGRADVVADIPSGYSGPLTLWTEDFQRGGIGVGTGFGWSWIPTVAVMHLNVSSGAGAYSPISAGTPLRSGAPVEVLGGPTGGFVLQGGEIGMVQTDIRLTAVNAEGVVAFSVDGISMAHDSTEDYKKIPFVGSARHAELKNTLELTVTNATPAHHPFHLHGFSFQPISFNSSAGVTVYSSFPHEFVDEVDIPGGMTLNFRVRLDDRLGPKKDQIDKLKDWVNGGGEGRWFFHCHILPHATFGMMSELHVHKAK
ncbi:MAG: multicopper oxidase family protein [Nitrospira sp.]|nr:multicopper oxidase family protein [Nitrospira sp.]MDH4303071.1 multicopper oxidase family protein [Nitrospira sp.]